MVMHDFEPGWDTYVERPGYGVSADMAVADVDAAGFDAVLVLGGRTPEYLRHNAQVLDLIRALLRRASGCLRSAMGFRFSMPLGLRPGGK